MRIPGPGEIVVGETVAGNGVASIPLCQRVATPSREDSAAPRWESRWGAIATNGIHGSLGTSTNMSSQAMAESSAISDCQRNGGTKCSIDVSYGNSCGAMVVGDNGYSVKAGNTLDEAIDSATAACGARDKNCHVYYKNCSMAMEVRQ